MTKHRFLSLVCLLAFLTSSGLLLTSCGHQAARSTSSYPPSAEAESARVGRDAGGYAQSATPFDVMSDSRRSIAVDEIWVLERGKPETALQTRSTPPSSRNPAPGRKPSVGSGDTKSSDSATSDSIDPVAAMNEPPPSGAMLAIGQSKDNPLVPMPLKHTDVRAEIAAYISTVEVRQEFHNPFDGKIEAVYVFPLPQNAAVNEFIMTIGERRIRGIIREKEEAERIYNQARAQGYVASLLKQVRPNIFQQRVANIEPGKDVDVTIRYFNTLSYSDGWYEFVFPMVVGPRFNPPGSTDGVGAIPRGSQGISGQSTEVSYLAPDDRSGHDIAMAVNLDAGVTIEEIESVNHDCMVKQVSQRTAKIDLMTSDSIPNKDFVLRYRVAGEHIKANMLVERSSDLQPGYFTLVLYPPQELKQMQRTPLDLVFVLDCSGSMNGQPIEQAKNAVVHALKQLTPADSFQIIRFSQSSSTFGPTPVPATAANVRRGVQYVRSLSGQGGTMMIEGIKAALDFPDDEERTRYVAFLTDGYIGNERQILGEINNRLGNSRIFSFGVGSSPNRYLMDRMAKMGRGVVAYLSLNDDARPVINRFLDRVSYPALADVRLEADGMELMDVYPQTLPDLFVGKPVIASGRFRGTGRATVHVRGRIGTEAIDIPVEVRIGEQADQHEGIDTVWARAKIAELYDRSTWDPDVELPDRIRTIALEYSLMSAWTSFVAVDSSKKTEGNFGTTVPIAVPVPDGVRYDTTVQGSITPAGSLASDIRSTEAEHESVP